MRPLQSRCLRGLLTLAGLGVLSCGSRTGLEYGPPLPPPPECYVASDCPTYGDFCNPVRCALFSEITDGGVDGSDGSDGSAVTTGSGTGGAGGALGGGGAGGTDGAGGAASLVHRKGGRCALLPPVDCNDNDPCTADKCAPETGACHYSYATLDSDGDGHRAPLVGTVAGAPGSCGDDCDDTNPNAYPGAKEVCDGVDNDCNGIVDDNAHWIPIGLDAVRVDGDLAPAGPGGLAWSGKVFASVYTGSTPDGFRVFASMLNPDGTKVVPPGETPVTFKNADASGGPVVWTGDRFGVTWQDRRTSDYEIYFAILGEDGAKKFNGDVQLTSAQGFSVNPAIAWNGNEFLTVWQDDRGGLFDLFAQRVDHDGNPIGKNLQLTHAKGLGNESPSVAAGTKTVGITWSLGDALNHIVAFQVFTTDLTKPAAPSLQLTDGTTDAVYPNVVWNNDRYVVSWYDRSANPKAIYGAVVSEDGTFLVKPKAITHPGAFRSRYPFMRALGDRLLLVYSDDRDQNQGYELYSELISTTLDPLGPEQRITNSKRDSVYPIAAFGPDGNLGVFFRDDRDNGDHHVWFTRLACAAGSP